MLLLEYLWPTRFRMKFKFCLSCRGVSGASECTLCSHGLFVSQSHVFVILCYFIIDVMTFTGKHVRKKRVWASFSNPCNLACKSEDGSSKAWLVPFCPQAFVSNHVFVPKYGRFFEKVWFLTVPSRMRGILPIEENPCLPFIWMETRIKCRIYVIMCL